MPTISVLPDSPHGYRAIAGDRQASGLTVGQAVDGLGPQPDETTLIIVQPQRPDTFFPADKRSALESLMGQWRAARDAGRSLDAADQSALDTLVREEVEAAGRRAAGLAAGLPS